MSRSPTNDPRIVFFGTPELSVYVLEELRGAGFVPSLVVTAPDRPQGRGLRVASPPVKVWAEQEGAAVIQPESLTGSPELDALINTDWDLFLVAAYGQIIPKDVLKLPAHGTLNVHPSLLPKLRGASPIRTAILGDIRETGVTIIMLDEEMDHGPIVAQARVEIGADDWPPPGRVLDELLMRAGGELLAEIIPAWIAGEIEAEAQDHSKATYSKKIIKEMGEIDLDDDPYRNLLKIRALDGWPGSYFFTERNGARVRVKIVDAELKDGGLHILRVIPEGKKETDYETFLKS